MTVAEMSKEEIIDLVRQDGIAPQAALEELKTRLPKNIFATKEWREKRAALIKDFCEKCGTIEGPFVLQHTWHPLKFADLCHMLKFSLVQEYAALHQEWWAEPAPTTLRDCCPKCGSTAIGAPRLVQKPGSRRYRHGDKRYWCRARTDGRYCGHQFDDPAKVLALTPEEKRAFNVQRGDAWRRCRDDVSRLYGDAVLKQALIVSHEQSERYMSMVDTVTQCRKCAFIADKRAGLIPDKPYRT